MGHAREEEEARMSKDWPCRRSVYFGLLPWLWSTFPFRRRRWVNRAVGYEKYHQKNTYFCWALRLNKQTQLVPHKKTAVRIRFQRPSSNNLGCLKMWWRQWIRIVWRDSIHPRWPSQSSAGPRLESWRLDYSIHRVGRESSSMAHVK